MTQDEMIEMAKQAGFDTDLPPFKDGTAIALKLAALVASAEREACAKRLDAVGCDHCAENIRRRGKE